MCGTLLPSVTSHLHVPAGILCAPSPVKMDLAGSHTIVDAHQCVEANCCSPRPPYGIGPASHVRHLTNIPNRGTPGPKPAATPIQACILLPTEDPAFGYAPKSTLPSNPLCGARTGASCKTTADARVRSPRQAVRPQRQRPQR